MSQETIQKDDGRIKLDNIANLRDVGQYINHISPNASVKLKPGLFYRSARPDAATDSDKHTLTATLGIQTIIDLRTPTEHLEQAKKASKLVPTSPAILPKDPTKPFRINEIDYKDVNFNGNAYSNALLKHLTWGQTAKLYGLYVAGYRKQAISVLGTNVMAPRGLGGLAEDSLVHCKAEVKAVFDVLSSEQSYPVLVHCTQGKDRTGLTALLVLLLCGADVEAIERDYMLSESELQAERQEKVEEIRSIGLPDEFADCEKGWAKRVSGFIEREFGDVEKYLDSCGVSSRQRTAVKRMMVAN